MVSPSSEAESAGWTAIPWETVEQEMRDRGQITESGLAEAKAEQDAYVTGYRLAVSPAEVD